MAVPFTTPSLAHARVRPAAGDALELLVPNVGGGKGSHVVELAGWVLSSASPSTIDC